MIFANGLVYSNLRILSAHCKVNLLFWHFHIFKYVCAGKRDLAKLKVLADHNLSLPDVSADIFPLIEVIPAQPLGLDADQPRNLANSVTVE